MIRARDAPGVCTREEGHRVRVARRSRLYGTADIEDGSCTQDDDRPAWDWKMVCVVVVVAGE